jgi:hypothetical protein
VGGGWISGVGTPVGGISGGTGCVLPGVGGVCGVSGGLSGLSIMIMSPEKNARLKGGHSYVALGLLVVLVVRVLAHVRIWLGLLVSLTLALGLPRLALALLLFALRLLTLLLRRGLRRVLVRSIVLVDLGFLSPRTHATAGMTVAQ